MGRFEDMCLGDSHDEQMGAKRGRSCPQQLACLLEAIRRANRGGRRVLACFLDVVRAYDSVNHVALFARLWEAGVTGSAWLTFRRWYDHLQSSVRLGGRSATEYFRQEQGTRQVSPLFYVVFMDELMGRLKALQVGLELGGHLLPRLMITDDVVLLAEDVSDMRVLLHETGRFASQWRVEFHVAAPSGGDAKSAMLSFCPRGEQLSTRFALSGEEIPLRSTCKYGGFWVSTDVASPFKIGIARRCASAARCRWGDGATDGEQLCCRAPQGL
eukprot:Lithocolla_globosa_v1_NODE_3375_length_1687_cov_19.176471.p1 type:complete len:271 gc:universal NODE_3375_length_1687_cov_19.176471:1092-280(-)